ncbi:hypothetical protein PR048_000259 [Dryococelus australis]|uniref:Uncharacterized protein n=1 Tax=Dryococelus australis TaxID=614101 RepID=A0ABQ9IEQ7_9NEOP|nr:hypothetical protein PR048_000259 [Dryococelus australis]
MNSNFHTCVTILKGGFTDSRMSWHFSLKAERRTFCRHQNSSKQHGRMIDCKDCLAVLGCSNAAATHKAKPVIGKSVCPRAFEDVCYACEVHGKYKSVDHIRLNYGVVQKFGVTDHNSIGLNPKCKIVLVLDICSAHCPAEKLKKECFFFY